MRNLLIIDDETELLEKIEFLLEDLADEVYTADNYEKAVSIMEDQDDICCVICDIDMPTQGGLDVIKSMRLKGYQVPFIFYSGRGEDDAMLESSVYGTFDFIMKPNFKQLEDSTRKAISIGERINNGEKVNLLEESNQTYKDLVDALRGS